MQAAVGGQRVAGVDRRRAGEVGEAPARLLHHDLARREVPGLEIDLDVHLRLALGHQRVAEIVAKAALTLGGVDEAHDTVPDAGLAVEAQARVQERRRPQVADVRDAHAPAVQARATALARSVELARDRVEDHAGDDLAVRLEGEQRCPHGDPAHEVLRAVDRVDDPAHVGGALGAELLAEEPPVGERAAQSGHDRLLGFAIGLGDRRVVGLDRDVEVAGVVLHRDAAGGARGVGGGGERPVERRRVERRRHRAAVSSAGNGSPRSPSTLA